MQRHGVSVARLFALVRFEGGRPRVFATGREAAWDAFATRHAINTACVRHARPLVSGEDGKEAVELAFRVRDAIEESMRKFKS